MAILQSRMIALIDAALDYQHAFEQLINLVHTEDMNIRKGLQTPEDAILNLAIQCNESTLLERPALSQSTITQELYHFKRNARRNMKEREYQEKRRARMGLAPKKTHFVPHYATEELGSIAERTTAFRVPGQNMRGDIPKHKPREPRELSPEAKWEIENRPPSEDLTPEQLEEYNAFRDRMKMNETEFSKGKDPFEEDQEKEQHK